MTVLTADQIEGLDYKQLGDALIERGLTDVPRSKDDRIVALRTAVAMATREPGRDTTQAQAVNVEEGLSADATLAEQPPRDDETIEEAIRRIREVRKPFGGQTQKLALPKRRGYHRHWFNDVGGRVDEAKASGWSHIKGRDGSPIRRAVGTGRDNGVLYAYAMELPEVFWQEDMDARHKEAAAKVDAIKESPARAKPGEAKRQDQGKFYNPVEDQGRSPIEVTKG